MWWIRYSGYIKKTAIAENKTCHDIHVDHLLAIHLEFTWKIKHLNGNNFSGDYKWFFEDTTYPEKFECA